MRACYDGYTDMARMLVQEFNADVNCQTNVSKYICDIIMCICYCGCRGVFVAIDIVEGCCSIIIASAFAGIKKNVATFIFIVFYYLFCIY